MSDLGKPINPSAASNRDLLCRWLSIPESPWPPDYYTLLGLAQGQGSSDEIELRVLMFMEKLRQHQLMQPDAVTEGMNLLAQALNSLTHAETRREYDRMLLARAKPSIPDQQKETKNEVSQSPVKIAPAKPPGQTQRRVRKQTTPAVHSLPPIEKIFSLDDIDCVSVSRSRETKPPRSRIPKKHRGRWKAGIVAGGIAFVVFAVVSVVFGLWHDEPISIDDSKSEQSPSNEPVDEDPVIPPPTHAKHELPPVGAQTPHKTEPMEQAGIENINKPDGEYVIGSLNDESKRVLRGVVRNLRLGSIGGKAIVDATELDAQSIIVDGSVTANGKLKLHSHSGTIEFRGKVDGGARVEIDTPKGKVIFNEPTVQGHDGGKITGNARVAINAPTVEMHGVLDGSALLKINAEGGSVLFAAPTEPGRDGARIGGNAKLVVRAKDLDFRSRIDGDAEIHVTVSTGGRISFHEMDQEAKIHYRKSQTNDPDPIIVGGTRKGGAAIIKVVVVTVRKKPEPRSEIDPLLADLIGTWHIVHSETDGDPHTLPKVKPTVKISDEEVIIKMGPEPERVVKVRYDSRHKPKHIDFIEENHVKHGIWEIDDDGFLNVCFAAAGKRRPEKFQTDGKNRFTLWELKRE